MLSEWVNEWMSAWHWPCWETSSPSFSALPSLRPLLTSKVALPSTNRAIHGQFLCCNWWEGVGASYFYSKSTKKKQADLEIMHFRTSLLAVTSHLQVWVSQSIAFGGAKKTWSQLFVYKIVTISLRRRAAEPKLSDQQNRTWPQPSVQWAGPSGCNGETLTQCLI